MSHRLLFAVLGVVVAAACAKRAPVSNRAPKPALVEDDAAVGETPAAAPATLFDRLIAACERGDAEACVQASNILAKPGASDAENRQRAALELRACELGHGKGCNDYGAALANGLGVERDNRLAVTYFAKACELGYQYGCTQYGNRLDQGRGVAQDKERARELFENACSKGEEKGCAQLGDLLADSDSADDRARATAVFERACRLGVALSCYRARKRGSSLKMPEGLARAQLARAIEACATGYGVGCYTAGQFHALGIGASIDIPKALVFHQRGCDLKFVACCENLARLTRGQRWREEVRLAAERCRQRDNRDGGACFLSGDALLHGRSVDADPKAAVALLGSGCELDNANACHTLAYAIYIGMGVAADKKRSLELVRKACRLGRLKSCSDGGRMILARDRNALEEALPLFDRGCKLGSGHACTSAAIALLRTGTAAPERTRALGYAARGCKLGYKHACALAKRIGSAGKRLDEPKAGKRRSGSKLDENKRAQRACYHRCFAIKDPNLTVRELRDRCEKACESAKSPRP